MMVGRTIGPYRILAKIGEGGMGEVYRAHDSRLKRDVALKILPSAVASDPERLARFQREAEILASLNHPNIAAIYGFESDGAGPALALELVEGDTLADRLATSAVPLDAVRPLARQLVEALDAAHQKGIVHRDLKPANIKVRPDGGLKVLDFGLAKAADTAKTADASRSPTVTAMNTRDGVILGTVAYMSPEQARGYSVDKRADIWAFGCVLYEMLTGRAAFARGTVTDTLAAVVERDADWSQLPAGTPSAMRRLLRRCLEKDVNRRLRDIGDARWDLEEQDESSTTTAESRRRPLERVAWAVAGLSLVVTAVVVWTSLSSAGSEDGAPQLSHPIRLTHTPQPEWGPSIAPDGKWVAYIAHNNGRSDVWVKVLQTGAVLNLTGSLALEVQGRTGQGSVEISPDGSLIAFTARERSSAGTYDTWIVPAPIGGAPRKLLAGRTALRWSPDGERLAAIAAGGGRGDGLIVANGDGTGQRDLVPLEGGRHVHNPAWSSDGKFVYFIYTHDSWNDEPSEIYRVSADGGKPEPVVQTIRRAVFPAPLPDLGGLIYAANPDSVDLGLWWEPIGGGASRSLTTGIGELTEPHVSADGRRLVARLTESRRPLMFVPVRFDRPPDARGITDGYTGDLDPSIDPLSNRLVFSSSRSGNRNLWLAQGDGSNPVPLTTERFIDERPSFSPDGKQIAFLSDRGGRRGIWVIAADGGTPRFIGPATVLGAVSWMPDGTRLMFARPVGNLPQLATIAVVNGGVESFATPGGATAPVWTAVTRRLAYIEPTLTAPVQQRIRFANEEGEPMFTAFPSDSATFNNAVMAWSPDGKRLAALSIVGNGGASLWIAEPEGREPLRKLLDLPTSVLPRGMTWSTDGSGVVIAYQDFASDIVLFDLSYP